MLQCLKNFNFTFKKVNYYSFSVLQYPFALCFNIHLLSAYGNELVSAM